MANKTNELCDCYNELIEYAELEGTEIADGCMGLLAAYDVMHYLSDEFTDAVIKEMNERLKYFKENCTITTKTITVTRTISELEWNDE